MFPTLACHAAPGAALLFKSGPEDGASAGSIFGHALYHARLPTPEHARLLKEHGFAVSLHRVAMPIAARIRCGWRNVMRAPKRPIDRVSTQ